MTEAAAREVSCSRPAGSMNIMYSRVIRGVYGQLMTRRVEIIGSRTGREPVSVMTPFSTRTRVLVTVGRPDEEGAPETLTQ